MFCCIEMSNMKSYVLCCNVCLNISDKYDAIENELIEEFRIAQHADEKRKMKKCASVLANFKVKLFNVFLYLIDSVK